MQTFKTIGYCTQENQCPSRRLARFALVLLYLLLPLWLVSVTLWKGLQYTAALDVIEMDLHARWQKISYYNIWWCNICIKTYLFFAVSKIKNASNVHYFLMVIVFLSNPHSPSFLHFLCFSTFAKSLLLKVTSMSLFQFTLLLQQRALMSEGQSQSLREFSRNADQMKRVMRVVVLNCGIVPTGKYNMKLLSKIKCCINMDHQRGWRSILKILLPSNLSRKEIYFK